MVASLLSDKARKARLRGVFGCDLKAEMPKRIKKQRVCMICGLETYEPCNIRAHALAADAAAWGLCEPHGIPHVLGDSSMTYRAAADLTTKTRLADMGVRKLSDGGRVGFSRDSQDHGMMTMPACSPCRQLLGRPQGTVLPFDGR
jgi:hypothetical protein